MRFTLSCIVFLFWAGTADASFINTRSVEVCTIPLPVTSHIRINRLLLNTKHIYLKVAGKTFGTPFTKEKTYFGGEAHLYTEDPFFKKFKGQGEKCYPTSFHSTDREEDYQKRLSCIASKMSIESSEDLNRRDWYPIFDYHALKNNCGSMANFVVECAKGEFTESINYSVGDRVEDDKAAFIVHQRAGYPIKFLSNYGDICQLALDECEEINNI